MTSLSGNTINIRQVAEEIQYNEDETNWIPIKAWPITIEKEGATVYFQSPLTLSINYQHFVCAADNITFGQTSQKSLINIVDCINYPGFIQNGSNGNFGYSNINIFNITVNAEGTTELFWIDLAGEDDDKGGGYICQQWFGLGATNNNIVNCHSNGCIAKGCGGLVGANSQNLTIIGCSSSGIIGYNGATSGVLGAGGIVGARCSYININACFSTGDIIGNHSGGIVGAYFRNAGLITNCFSRGDIIGAGAGGIAGYGVDDTRITACYSTGLIKGNRGGGLVGAFANSVEIRNCFTTGHVVGEKQISGAICGSHSVKNNIRLINCYTCGQVDNGGYFNSPKLEVLLFEGCYSEAKHGNATGKFCFENAEKTLEMDSWVKNEHHFSLCELGLSPYIIDNITVAADKSCPSLVRRAEMRIIAGEFSASAIDINDNNNFSLLGVHRDLFTIDKTSGIISTKASTPGDMYILWVLNNSETNYSYTKVVLNVIAPKVQVQPKAPKEPVPKEPKAPAAQQPKAQPKAVSKAPAAPAAPATHKVQPKAVPKQQAPEPVIAKPMSMSYMKYNSPSNVIPVGITILPETNTPVNPMGVKSLQAKVYRT